MKLKIILLFLIMSIIGYGQKKQFAKHYTEVITTQKGVDKDFFSENIIFFNYENKPVIKIYTSDQSVNFYDKISEEELGTLEGKSYISALYKERKDSTKVLVQLFDDDSIGCRLIYLNGDMVRFIP